MCKQPKETAWHIVICKCLEMLLLFSDQVPWWRGAPARSPGSLLKTAWIQTVGSPFLLLPSRSSQILLWKFLPQFRAEITACGALTLKTMPAHASTRHEGPSPCLENGGPAQEPTRHGRKPAILQTREARSPRTYTDGPRHTSRGRTAG